MEFALLIISLLVIVKASDILVDASVSIAERLKVPKILIALTIMAFSTCAPELAVSFTSIASGNGTIAFANVIGSCIVNILLVIGLAAVIIGEVFCDAILGKKANFAMKLAFVVFGAIIYYVVIGIVIWLRMDPNDLKLFTAIIVAIFLAVPYIRGKQKNSFKMAGKRSAHSLAAANEKKEV